jgi:hypothetical protein
MAVSNQAKYCPVEAYEGIYLILIVFHGRPHIIECSWRLSLRMGGGKEAKNIMEQWPVGRSVCLSAAGW